MSDQSKFLGYRSGHSMGFGCAGIEEEAARLRRDLSEALGLLRAHQGATASSGDDPGWQAWDAAVAALLAKYPP